MAAPIVVALGHVQAVPCWAEDADAMDSISKWINQDAWQKMHTSRRIQRWSFGGTSPSYRSMWLDVFSLSSYTAMGLASPSGRRACAAAAVLMVMLPHMLNPVGASDSIITCVIHVHVCHYLKQSILQDVEGKCIDWIGNTNTKVGLTLVSKEAARTESVQRGSSHEHWVFAAS